MKKKTELMRVSGEFATAVDEINKKLNDRMGLEGRDRIKKTEITEVIAKEIKNNNQQINMFSLFTDHKRTKRGTTSDFIAVLIVFFVFALSVGVAAKMLMEWNDYSNENDVVPERFQNQADDMENRMPAIFGGIGIFFVIGASIAAVLGALAIRTNPAFYFISIIILIFFTLISIFFMDIYDQVSTSEHLVDAFSGFTALNYLMTVLPIFTVIISSIIAIVTYSKGAA